MMHSSLFIPEQPLSLLDTLEAAGEECWVVGGCVRDSLMGKPVSVYGFLMKSFRLLCKTVPHGVILKIMSRISGKQVESPVNAVIDKTP